MRAGRSMQEPDLHVRFRWYGLCTQRTQAIPATAILEPEQLEDKYYMLRIPAGAVAGDAGAAVRRPRGTRSRPGRARPLRRSCRRPPRCPACRCRLHQRAPQLAAVPGDQRTATGLLRESGRRRRTSRSASWSRSRLAVGASPATGGIAAGTLHCLE